VNKLREEEAGKNSIELGKVDFGGKDAAVKEYLNPFDVSEGAKSLMNLLHSIFGSGRSDRKDKEETLS